MKIHLYFDASERPSFDEQFEAAYRTRHHLVLSTRSRYGMPDTEVDEIVEDAFVQLWQKVHRGGLGAPDNVTKYVATIAANLVADRLRRKRREAQAVRQLAGLPAYRLPTTEDGFTVAMINEFAATCRRVLRPEDYQVLVMRVQGYTQEEIAKQLGVPSIRSHLRRIRQIMVEQLGVRPRTVESDATVRDRPDPGAALTALGEELRKLCAEAGGPSVRQLAFMTPRQTSYPTIHRALACQRLPRWEVVESIVTALDGDIEPFWRLWVHAKGPDLFEVAA